MNTFKVGDRVAVKYRNPGRNPDWPRYGHVIRVYPTILIRDSLGGEWGLPATLLEHID